MTTVALFPGTGIEIADWRELTERTLPDLLERCCELVGQDPFPRAADSTRFAQPALLCASLAAWEDLSPRNVIAVAGHSLGDLAALAVGGVLAAEDALELAVLRGRLMADGPIDAVEAPLLDAARRVKICEPRVAVFSSMTANLFADVPVELAQAPARPVLWDDTLFALDRLGAKRFVDVGPGPTLAPSEEEPNGIAV